MRTLDRLCDEFPKVLELVYEMGNEITAFRAAEVRIATAGSFRDSDSNEVRRDAVLFGMELITGVEICFFDDGKNNKSYSVIKLGDSYSFVTTSTTRTKLTIYTVEPSIKVISQTTARRSSTEYTPKFTIADVYLALQLVGSGANPSTLASSSTPNTTDVPNPYAAAI